MIERLLHLFAPWIPDHPAVVRAISLLDALDGDADLEPEPEEPDIWHARACR